MRKYGSAFREAWRNGGKRTIIKSIALIGIVAAIAVGVTISYFADTETSTGNQFVAGKLNLKIDNTCHYNGMVCTAGKVWAEESTGSAADPDMIGDPCECTWSAKDLENELFFNFLDVKPGDEGEDTVSLHVDNNDAWVCAEIANLKNFDNGCDSPENKVDDVANSCGDPGEGEGELQDSLFFSVWKDNGAGANACNNVKDADETYLVENQSAASNFWPIADSTTGSGPIEGGETTCLGISWNVPIETTNIIQTDSLVGDVIFNAVQARNIPNFTCSSLYTEVCDGKDNTYNGLIDEGPLWTNKDQACSVGTGACSATGTWICDAGNSAGPTVCSATAGTPGVETCNGIDDDCDGEVDEGLFSTYYRDSDNDTYGDPRNTRQFCSAVSGYVLDGTDCRDNMAAVHPGATEACNSIDDDCDGQTDEGVSTTYYRDLDGDTFGSPTSPIQACSLPAGYVTNNQDCNDTNANIKPGAIELAGDERDENCDGKEVCFRDSDNDNYRTTSTFLGNDLDCTDPGEATKWKQSNDCNDNDSSIHPWAQEYCNGINDDCDSQTDEDFPENWQTCRSCPFYSPDWRCVSGALYCPPC